MRTNSPSPDKSIDPDFVGVFGNSTGVIPSLRQKYKATIEYDKILARRKNSSYLDNKGGAAKA